jgi:hypothetical protein
VTIDEGQRDIDGISRRSVLRGGLLAGAGVATVGAMSAVLTGTAKASTPSPQYDWGYCHYCTTMWWTPGQSGSACASPEAPDYRHGVGSGSYNYGLYNGIPGLVNTSDPQPNWRWCTACQGLFWGGDSGLCAGTGLNSHVAGGTSYDLYFNTSGQAYWHWCTNCSLLYWQGASGDTAGYCPAGIGDPGGTPHVGGSTVYDIGWSGTY